MKITTRLVAVLRELARSVRGQFLQLPAFLSAILIVLLIAFLYWVQLPLRKLSRSLATSDATPLEGLQKQKTEYRIRRPCPPCYTFFQAAGSLTGNHGA